MEWTSQFKPTFGTPLDLSHPLTKGLVLSMLFNEGSGKIVNDSSGQGNNGLCVNMNDPSIVGSGWNFDPYGGALAVDGSNDYVSISSANFLSLIGQTYTLAVWIKDDTLAGVLAAGFHRIISWANGTTNIQLGLGGNDRNHNRGFYIEEDTAGDKLPKKISAEPSPGWHCVVGTFDGAGTYHLYMDGKLSESGNFGGSSSTTYVTNTGYLYIGQRGNGGYVNGLISSVSIYNRALSAEEIAYKYAFPWCMYDDTSGYFPFYNRFYRRYAIDSRSGIGVM